MERAVLLQVILETSSDGHIVPNPVDCGIWVRDAAGKSDHFPL